MRSSLWAKCVRLSASMLFAAALLIGQSAEAPASAPSSQPAEPEWSVGPIDFSGLIDAYYTFNFNHPASRINQLRSFDTQANQFSLNMAKLVMEHAPAPVGFRVDLGFGRAFDVIHGAEQSPGVFQNILQAYVSVAPASAKGLQLDFGKFVTAAGAEVIESHLNWNYSRSLLFGWTIPFYHFGARASMPLHKNFTAGVQLVNGWNNVEDNNSGKTVGLTGAFTHDKVTWSHAYYVGPEKTDTNKGVRHVYDTVLMLTPSGKFNMYVNFDYGVEKNIMAPSEAWYGIGTAARIAPNDWFALTPRIEWFKDRDGFATGTAQALKSFTITSEFRMKEGIFMRPEYRRDWSDQPFFDRGSVPGTYKRQDTFLVGFVAYFGPKR